MSLFAYEAIDHRGRRKQGELEADSDRAARQQLKSKKLIVRQLSIIERPSKQQSSARVRALSSDEIVLFLQQLSTLVEAGMPLLESLSSIAEGTDKKRTRLTLLAIAKHVSEGGSLAEALRQQHFDVVVCNMIEAGEETGQLQAVAARLASLLEYRQQMQQDLLSATLYPAIIMGFGLLVMLFLMTVVVPKMVAVFEHTGAELPALTRMVMSFSDFLRDDGLFLLLAIMLLLTLYKALMKKISMRWLRDRFLLRLPLISKLLISIDTARFTRTLGMLLEGGVAVLPAMSIANQSWSLLPLQAMGEQARHDLRDGESLAASFKKSAYLPAMAIHLLSVGEQSGQLHSMLLRVANHYEREVSRHLKRLMTVAEPLLVMFMALGVGALAMAVLLPIVEMNQLVQ